MRHSFRRRPAEGARRGSIAVFAAVTLVILMIGAAFSVDMAYMFLAREELHVATDAACKAAVSALSSGATQSAAQTAAVNCAAANTVCGRAVTLTTSQVELGSVTYNSTGYWTFNAAGTPKTAARVTGTFQLPLLFAPFLGTSSYTPQMQSTAAFVRNKICLVIDRSGSMCFDMTGVDYSYPPNGSYYDPPKPGSRWSYLASGLNTFLNSVGSSPVQNQVGLVTFASNSSSDASFSTTYTTIRTKITNYGANDMIGGTEMSAGISNALTMFSNSSDGTPWNKIMIVFSDGQWNEGINPLTQVNSIKSAGIVVYTIGLLPQANNATMSGLASQTGGSFYYAANATDLQNAFDTISRTIPVIITQ